MATSEHKPLANDPCCFECDEEMQTLGDFGPVAMLTLCMHYIREHPVALFERLAARRKRPRKEARR